jgi:hypothetical protein
MFKVLTTPWLVKDEPINDKVGTFTSPAVGANTGSPPQPINIKLTINGLKYFK